MPGESKKKRCFVVGPIGHAGTPIRIHADWLLEEIIEPVFQEFPDFEVVRADKISQPGMIDAQVIGNLIEAELVVADLSHVNPNAFYEIGIRHMVQKPIIHMQLVDGEIPFDVSLYRATKFSRVHPSDLRQARKDLKVAVVAVLADGYIVDNPVTRVKGQIEIEQRATPEQKLLIEQYKGIQTRLEKLELSSKRRTKARPKGIQRSVNEEGLVIEVDDDMDEARAQVATLLTKDGFYIEMYPGEIFVPGVDSSEGFEHLTKVEGFQKMYVRR